MSAEAVERQGMRWALSEGVVEVELRRLPCNEIGLEALDELESLLQWLKPRQKEIGALLFYSSVDKGFSAGADLRALHGALKQAESAKARSDKSWDHPLVQSADLELRRAFAYLHRGLLTRFQLPRFLDRIHRVFDAIDMLPYPTVAALHGFCFGGGFELALTCDLRIADKSTRFCFPELRLGLIPGFGGIPRLRREIGNGIIRDLLLTGCSMGATRAHEVGLVSQVVGRGQALEAARRVVQQVRRFDRHTASAAKAFIKTLPAEELARERALFIELFGSKAVRAALDRFVQSEDLRPYLP